MDGMIFSAPADPENWRYIVLPDTAGWVPVTSHDLDQRATDAEAETFAAAAQLVAGVKAEAQRRIIALTGSADLVTHQIRSDNMIARQGEFGRILMGTMRDDAGDLMPARALTAAEDAEDRAIAAVWRAIKHLRTKSNELEAMDPIPADFASDAYWT